MADSLPEDTRLIVIRRGETMRVMFPVDPKALWKVKPPEMAAEAILAFMELQSRNPGRADMPITSDTGHMGLTFRDSDFVMDPEVNLYAQCEGRWEDFDVAVAEEGTPHRSMPTVVMNLDDIHD